MLVEYRKAKDQQKSDQLKIKQCVKRVLDGRLLHSCTWVACLASYGRQHPPLSLSNTQYQQQTGSPPSWHAQRRQPSARWCARMRAPRAAPPNSCWTHSGSWRRCAIPTLNSAASWPGERHFGGLRALAHGLLKQGLPSRCTVNHTRPLSEHQPTTRLQREEARHRFSCSGRGRTQTLGRSAEGAARTSPQAWGGRVGG